jgi:hypothetical protein
MVSPFLKVVSDGFETLFGDSQSALSNQAVDGRAVDQATTAKLDGWDFAGCDGAVDGGARQAQGAVSLVQSQQFSHCVTPKQKSARTVRDRQKRCSKMSIGRGVGKTSPLSFDNGLTIRLSASHEGSEYFSPYL